MLYARPKEASTDAVIHLLKQFLTSFGTNASRATIPLILLDHAKERLAESSYSDVSAAVRCLHQVASMCIALEEVSSKRLSNGDNPSHLRETIRVLDTTKLVSGMPFKTQKINDLVERLQKVIVNDSTRMAKDLAIGEEPISLLPVPYKQSVSISRIAAPSITSFQHILKAKVPVILSDAIGHWPALSARPWTNLNYLITTIGPDRIVPVEIGSSYADETWTQKLVTVRDFFNHLTDSTKTETWYLAQHNLFSQFPVLGQDLIVPDYCYASISDTDDAAGDAAGDVKMNAWFGPSSTYSPLHTDPYENLLAQVVGFKRVMLVSPSDSSCVYPYDPDSMLNNTAQVCLIYPCSFHI